MASEIAASNSQAGQRFDVPILHSEKIGHDRNSSASLSKAPVSNANELSKEEDANPDTKSNMNTVTESLGAEQADLSQIGVEEVESVGDDGSWVSEDEVLDPFSPIIYDQLETTTSIKNDECTASCLPLLSNLDAIPPLNTDSHADFLHDGLDDYPAPYVVIDASRPWMLYWNLAGLGFLGQNTTVYRERAIGTISAMQNVSGGFGGGHGQWSHLAGSYAAVLSLITVGGEDAYRLIDRRAIWQWLGRLKQPDGGFRVAEDGEEDIRGAYTALTLISLLDLPLQLPDDSLAKVNGNETFLTGLCEWVGRCQTYEGGIAAAPGNEAHGGYAFCGLAVLCIAGGPQDLHKWVNVPALVRFLAMRQTAPEGGFSGRTNKLVDACYSHWIGGCWPLIEAALNDQEKTSLRSLWNRQALARYILCCCQGKKGGLRDKPTTRPDSYHTCYALAGLNSAQNRYAYFDNRTNGDTQQHESTNSLTAPFQWSVIEPLGEDGVPHKVEEWMTGETRVGYIHPVFVVPWGAAERARAYFEKRGWP